MESKNNLFFVYDLSIGKFVSQSLIKALKEGTIKPAKEFIRALPNKNIGAIIYSSPEKNVDEWYMFIVNNISPSEQQEIEEKAIKLKTQINPNVVLKKVNLNEFVSFLEHVYTKIKLSEKNATVKVPKMNEEEQKDNTEVRQKTAIQGNNMKEEPLLDIDFNTTAELTIPPKLVDQVIGQDQAVNIIRKAALQRRNVLLIGEPGTGKSMLGHALSELLPKERLEDILCIANLKNPHNPKIVTVPAGEGKVHVEQAMEKARKAESFKHMMALLIPLSIILITVIYSRSIDTILFSILVALFAFMIISQLRLRSEILVPKLLVDNSNSDTAPFIDATGAHAGALLGDVRHDPFQSGGLGTPAHERVEVGLIHKAHKGVLYIDEIGTLHIKTQQQLLTAIQEKKFPITGQSELSSGAMVRTDPVPCDFVLVAAGNMETVRNMHPALRSRIRGQGYEIYMETTMPDTLNNRRKLARFVAQEVVKDKHIPHFTKKAVEEIIVEARRRANRKKHLTLLLRDLGGLIRAAGDLAIERKKPFVTEEEVRDAKYLARTLEHQLTEQYVKKRKEYRLIITEGAKVGRVNGLAVLGSDSGIVLPIEAEIAPASSSREGRIIATGQLRIIAREAVQNVSALIKKFLGHDITNYDIHVQFIGTYGVEGDSASIAIATAVISAIENAPIRQDTAMTGSLSVRGEVLPIGGITAKVEGAIDAGIKRVILPKQNLDDLILSDDKKGKIEIIPVETISEVLREVLIPTYVSLADRFIDLNMEPITKEKSIINSTNPTTPTTTTKFHNPTKGL